MNSEFLFWTALIVTKFLCASSTNICSDLDCVSCVTRNCQFVVLSQTNTGICMEKYPEFKGKIKMRMLDSRSCFRYKKWSGNELKDKLYSIFRLFFEIKIRILNTIS